MGHAEMKLAVAGLDDNTIADLRKKLSGADWSMFRPAEQAAFRFARKQALNPDAVTASDYQNLVDHFGSEQALDVVWWICQCHYMTRIADAFQLPLEIDNVFDGFRPANGGEQREGK
jgi:alkylhydroperoxidase family enzyme